MTTLPAVVGDSKQAEQSLITKFEKNCQFSKEEVMFRDKQDIVISLAHSTPLAGMNVEGSTNYETRRGPGPRYNEEERNNSITKLKVWMLFVLILLQNNLHLN